MKYKATFKLTLDVEFDDDGETALPDQAHDALAELLPHDIHSKCWDVDLFFDPEVVE